MGAITKSVEDAFKTRTPRSQNSSLGNEVEIFGGQFVVKSEFHVKNTP